MIRYRDGYNPHRTKRLSDTPKVGDLVATSSPGTKRAHKVKAVLEDGTVEPYCTTRGRFTVIDANDQGDPTCGPCLRKMKKKDFSAEMTRRENIESSVKAVARFFAYELELERNKRWDEFWNALERARWAVEDGDVDDVSGHFNAIMSAYIAMKEVE